MSNIGACASRQRDFPPLEKGAQRTDVLNLELARVSLGELIVVGRQGLAGFDDVRTEDAIFGTRSGLIESLPANGDLVEESPLDATLVKEDCARRQLYGPGSERRAHEYSYQRHRRSRGKKVREKYEQVLRSQWGPALGHQHLIDNRYRGGRTQKATS